MVKTRGKGNANGWLVVVSELSIHLLPNFRHNAGGSRIPQSVSINYLLIIYEDFEFAEPTGNGLDLKIVSVF